MHDKSFSGWACPKCHRVHAVEPDAPEYRWCLPLWWQELLYDCPSEEHFHITCKRCGYSFLADSEGEPI